MAQSTVTHCADGEFRELAGRPPEAMIPAKNIATAGVPPGEWHGYGRTPGDAIIAYAQPKS